MCVFDYCIVCTYYTSDIDCGVPETLANTEVSKPGRYGLGTVVWYNCTGNHKFHDGQTTKSIVCQGYGLWSNISSDCQGVHNLILSNYSPVQPMVNMD